MRDPRWRSGNKPVCVETMTQPRIRRTCPTRSAAGLYQGRVSMAEQVGRHLNHLHRWAADGRALTPAIARAASDGIAVCCDAGAGAASSPLATGIAAPFFTGGGRTCPGRTA